MSSISIPDDAVNRLNSVKELWKADKGYLDCIGHKDIVIDKYRRLFSPENIKNLSKEDFYSFLKVKNNHHWMLHWPHGNNMTSDMQSLQKALIILLDESK